jgi:membrane protein
MSLIAQRHREGSPAWTLPQLTQRLGVPSHAMRAVLGALRQSDILAQTGDDPPAYLPARDLTRFPVRSLLEAVRSAGEDRYLNPASLPAPAAVEHAIERIELGMHGALNDLCVAELAGEALAAGTQGVPGAADRPGSAPRPEPAKAAETVSHPAP